MCSLNNFHNLNSIYGHCSCYVLLFIHLYIHHWKRPEVKTKNLWPHGTLSVVLNSLVTSVCMLKWKFFRRVWWQSDEDIYERCCCYSLDFSHSDTVFPSFISLSGNSKPHYIRHALLSLTAPVLLKVDQPPTVHLDCEVTWNKIITWAQCTCQPCVQVKLCRIHRFRQGLLAALSLRKDLFLINCFLQHYLIRAPERRTKGIENGLDKMISAKPPKQF